MPQCILLPYLLTTVKILVHEHTLAPAQSQINNRNFVFMAETGGGLVGFPFLLTIQTAMITKASLTF